MLASSRQQLSRTSSRLTQTAGLTSLDLGAEVVAFAYGAVGAAVEVALKEAIDDALGQLRGPAPHTLSPVQFAAAAEATFAAFADGERTRGRFAVKRAIELRRDFVRDVRGVAHRPPAPSVVTMSGVPHPEHFSIFFEITTNGTDPRGGGASPPLPRLVGRVNQVRGPRNDFAHECSDPTQHELVVGRTRDLPGLSGEVAKLQTVIADLQVLMDVLELACAHLCHRLAGRPPATAPGRRRWWQNRARQLVAAMLRLRGMS